MVISYYTDTKEVRNVFFVENGRIDRDSIEYHKNGHIALEGLWVFGKNKIYVASHENSTIQCSKRYIDGVLEGEYIE